MTLIRVDLPHPFGPRIAMCSPTPTVSDTSFKARIAPRMTETFSNSIKAGRSMLGPIIIDAGGPNDLNLHWDRPGGLAQKTDRRWHPSGDLPQDGHHVQGRCTRSLHLRPARA